MGPVLNHNHSILKRQKMHLVIFFCPCERFVHNWVFTIKSYFRCCVLIHYGNILYLTGWEACVANTARTWFKFNLWRWRHLNAHVRCYKYTWNSCAFRVFLFLQRPHCVCCEWSSLFLSLLPLLGVRNGMQESAFSLFLKTTTNISRQSGRRCVLPCSWPIAKFCLECCDCPRGRGMWALKSSARGSLSFARGEPQHPR